MKIVQEIAPGQFAPFNGGPVRRKFTTANLIYADGRSEEKSVAEYVAEVSLAKAAAERMDDAALAANGLHRVEDFAPPSGKRAISAPRWERRKGMVVEVRDVEDVPPSPVLSPEEKLAALGLTRDELKALVNV